MFTGIIEAVGQITAVQTRAGDCRILVDVGTMDLTDVKLGDSIATNGICLTVTDLEKNGFWADVSNETLRHSSLAGVTAGTAVNLEKAMLASDRFGGHIVSGHVDGLAQIKSLTKDARSIRIEVDVDSSLQKYIAHKGSITIDGVSLTVNELTASGFLLNIVPHTAEQTIIVNYQPGTKVNIEVDVIARYLEQLMLGSEQQTTKTTIDKAFLAANGFYKR